MRRGLQITSIVVLSPVLLILISLISMLLCFIYSQFTYFIFPSISTSCYSNAQTQQRFSYHHHTLIQDMSKEAAAAAAAAAAATASTSAAMKVAVNNNNTESNRSFSYYAAIKKKVQLLFRPRPSPIFWTILLIVLYCRFKRKEWWTHGSQQNKESIIQNDPQGTIKTKKKSSKKRKGNRKTPSAQHNTKNDNHIVLNKKSEKPKPKQQEQQQQQQPVDLATLTESVSRTAEKQKDREVTSQCRDAIEDPLVYNHQPSPILSITSSSTATSPSPSVAYMQQQPQQTVDEEAQRQGQGYDQDIFDFNLYNSSPIIPPLQNELPISSNDRRSSVNQIRGYSPFFTGLNLLEQPHHQPYESLSLYKLNQQVIFNDHKHTVNISAAPLPPPFSPLPPPPPGLMYHYPPPHYHYPPHPSFPQIPYNSPFCQHAPTLVALHHSSQKQYHHQQPYRKPSYSRIEVLENHPFVPSYSSTSSSSMSSSSSCSSSSTTTTTTSASMNAAPSTMTPTTHSPHNNFGPIGNRKQRLNNAYMLE